MKTALLDCRYSYEWDYTQKVIDSRVPTMHVKTAVFSQPYKHGMVRDLKPVASSLSVFRSRLDMHIFRRSFP